MRKIILSILLISTMILCACGNKEDGGKKTRDKSDNSSDISLEQCAKEGTDGIIAFAQNEDLISIIIPDDKVIDRITTWGNAKPNLSDRKEMIISDKAIDMMIKNGMDEDKNTPELKNYMKNRMCSGIVNMINSKMGADTLAATGVANYSKSYIMNEEMDDQLWIIPSDVEGVAYAVVFTNTGDNVITVITNYIIYNEDESLDDIVNTIKMQMMLGD